MGVVEKGIGFVDWVESRRRPVQAEDIAAHFEVSRATAYRWLAAYGDARGLFIEPRTNARSARSLDIRRALRSASEMRARIAAISESHEVQVALVTSSMDHTIARIAKDSEEWLDQLECHARELARAVKIAKVLRVASPRHCWSPSAHSVIEGQRQCVQPDPKMTTAPSTRPRT